MPTVRITAFGGMQPRTSPRLLPDNGALRAENVKLSSGQLVPINQPRIVYTPNKPLPALSIYRARNTGVSAGWLTWPMDVDVVRAPLPAEVESRYYWTGEDVPRMAEHTEAVSGAGDDYPHVSFALGVPKPQDKPTVTPTGGVGSTVTRFYCCTFFSEKGEESAPSPISASTDGKVDGTWALSNLPEFPVNSGVMTGVYSGGYTTFTTTGKHWLREHEPIWIGGKKIVVTSVVSPTSFKVLEDHSAAIAWARVADWNITGMKRRLYRTAGSSGSWQMVSDDVGTTYTDNLTDSQILGDELISEGWLPPDPRMTGFCVHASGSVVGFVGNQIYFSEPMQPHAWPEAYTLATDYPIVGISPFASEIAAATIGNPYVVSGVEPAAMSAQKIDGLSPCVSKRSMISVGDGSIYASNHGLVYVGSDGVKIFTEAFYTRDEWIALNPASMVCEYANGRVYCSYITAKKETGILIFDGGVLTEISLAVSDMYADQSTGELYLSLPDGIYLFDPQEQSYPMMASWRSKEFVFQSPCNLGAAKIDFKMAIDPAVLTELIQERADLTAQNQALLSAGGFFGSMNNDAYNVRGVNGSKAYNIPPIPPSNDVQFVLRSGDEIIFQRTVTTEKAFRLPAGVRYDHGSVEISGQGVVYDLRMAETMTGLKAV